MVNGNGMPSEKMRLSLLGSPAVRLSGGSANLSILFLVLQEHPVAKFTAFKDIQSLVH
jgi:hypothetical protein